MASCGLIGLESCLGVVKKVLVDDEDLRLMDMIKLLTVSPRKIMGFDNDLLKEGKEAELVLFNEDEKWVFNKNDINSKSNNSPFIDAQLSGKVIHTISKGRYYYKLTFKLILKYYLKFFVIMFEIDKSFN